MAIDRDTLRQLDHLLRPLRTRLANAVARAVVKLVSDVTKMQELQVGVLDGETVEGAEHFQPYGFSSVPLAGAEGVALFPNGDRGHPLVVAVADRRYRPTGGEAGEVTVYSKTGARVRLLASGDIEIQPAPGGEVFVRQDGGSAVALATKADLDAVVAYLNRQFDPALGHTHKAVIPTQPTNIVESTIVPPAPGSGTAPSPAGTTTLKAE